MKPNSFNKIFGSITIKGDYEISCKFHGCDYFLNSNQVQISLFKSSNYDIDAIINFDGNNTGLYPLKKGINDIIITKDHICYKTIHNRASGEIFIVNFNSKVISGTFSGSLFSKDNKHIFVKGYFKVPKHG